MDSNEDEVRKSVTPDLWMSRSLVACESAV